MSELNGYVTRDCLLNADTQRKRYTDAEIDGLGKVRIRSLDDREYMRLQSAVMKPDGTIDKVAAQTSNARWIVACVVDGEGNPIFTEGDVREIRERDAALTQRLADACKAHVERDLEGNE